MSHQGFPNIISSIFSLAFVALFATFVSCTNDEIDSPIGDRRIRFEVYTDGDWSRTGSKSAPEADASLSTIALKANERQLFLIPEITPGIDLGSNGEGSRAETVTNETINDFGVYASIENSADGYYMHNVEVTKENSWAPLKEYLWPGSGSLHINAYSPYCAVTNATSGIVAINEGNPASNISAKLQYIVPSEVTEQNDLLWAMPRQASASPCSMKFNHALAAVRFVTGSGMAPCTVKSISISGLLGSGTLDLEEGTWTNVSGNENYTATVNTVLASSAEDGNVEEGTIITDVSHTFMLMPQVLGDEATVAMVIEYEGTEMEFSAKLEGQSWGAGNTYTYHLSANPVLDRFEITVDSPISFNYTGGKSTFAVKSICETMQNGVLTTSDVPWTAEFIDADGNVISTPSWITMATTGTGSGEYDISAQMVEPTFVNMSEPTRILRQQAELGSAASPYNLANSSGDAAVENTANCYVINAPGTYSIPLVYGNAIKKRFRQHCSIRSHSLIGTFCQPSRQPHKTPVYLRQ